MGIDNIYIYILALLTVLFFQNFLFFNFSESLFSFISAALGGKIVQSLREFGKTFNTDSARAFVPSQVVQDTTGTDAKT